MPTAYTHAHRYASVLAVGEAAAHAAYNNLPAWTLGMLLRYDPVAGTFFVSRSPGFRVSPFNPTTLSFLVDRATTDTEITNTVGIATDNTWRWLFLTYVRSTDILTVIRGPRAGTMVEESYQGAGVGAHDSDAASPLLFGLTSQGGITDIERAFGGYWDRKLTTAEAQEVATDLSTAVRQPVAAWFPNASNAASIPNYIIANPVLPPLAMTLTTLVAGPDTAPPPPLVQNGFRLVPGTLPLSPVIGVEYVIQGEAIDTTQGNARVTTFQAASVIFGADIGTMPDGLVVISGDTDEPMVNGLVTWTLTFANAGVAPPIVIIPVRRRARFSASPSVPQTSGALFSGSVVGTIQTLLGNTDAAYVTPVELVMRNGDGSVIGQSVVTPVAGAFTFAAVGVRLTENASFSEVNLGILGFEGQTQPILVQALQLLPSLIVASSNVPRSSSAAPVAVVQIVGPVVGGSLFLEATANGTVWSLIDFTPYVAGAVVNTPTDSFFGRVSVEGLTAVRVRRANLNVTYDSITLTVFGG